MREKIDLYVLTRSDSCWCKACCSSSRHHWGCNKCGSSNDKKPSTSDGGCSNEPGIVPGIRTGLHLQSVFALVMNVQGRKCVMNGCWTYPSRPFCIFRARDYCRKTFFCSLRSFGSRTSVIFFLLRCIFVLCHCDFHMRVDVGCCFSLSLGPFVQVCLLFPRELICRNQQ